jgi:DNA-binding NarL/FixJ family response regulator
VLKDTEKEYPSWLRPSALGNGGTAAHERRRSGTGEAQEPGSGALLLDGTDHLARGGASGDPSKDTAIVIYLDPRAFTRDCVARWLQANLSGFSVRPLPDPDRISGGSVTGDRIRAVVINTGAARMSSASTADLVSRVKQLLPGVPVAILSDHEDRENLRQAFNLGVQGYIPTSLASLVAAGALSLVCVGGTFAPANVLLSEDTALRAPAPGRSIEGFTHRQTQILDCLRRGLSNRLIAFELAMCESTVKVHIRNIMKKLDATNRTQVVYLTRGLFEDDRPYQGA